MLGSFWTNAALGAPTAMHAVLGGDNGPPIVSDIPVGSRDPNNPTIISIVWVYPLKSGTNHVGFTGNSEIGRSGINTGPADWYVSLIIVVP